MGNVIDRTGQRFGKLVALRENGRNSYKKVMWECICDCGNVISTVAGALTTGNTKSCGCSKGYIKHRASYKSSYHSWRAMRRRCNNPKDKDYPKYGARGITVCPEWEDYLVFVSDMGEPIGNQTLDRIDTYGNYEKSNCRWASITTQNRNRRVADKNKTGYIGVMYKNGKWYGGLTCKGKKYYSKACTSLEEAVMARKQLECTHWGNT